jgi:hypothetical protein
MVERQRKLHDLKFSNLENGLFYADSVKTGDFGQMQTFDGAKD